MKRTSIKSNITNSSMVIKSTSFSTSCVSIILLFTSFFVQGQDIPNAGFENWFDNGGFEDPVSWTTPNETSYVFPVNMLTTTKTTESNNGNYAAKLETKYNIITGTVPALLTLGNFEVDIFSGEATISGGIPFTKRPDSIHASIRYYPAEGDSCLIGVFLLKYNSSTGKTDTVGIGGYSALDTIDSYTQVSNEITYYSDETPDTMNIIIVNTDYTNPLRPSILYVDDLYLSYAPESPDDTLLHPSPNLDSEIKLCRGDSSLLEVGYHPAYEYDWQTPAGTISSTYSIWAKQEGRYTVNITGEGVDSTSDQSTISLVDYPDIELGDTLYLRQGYSLLLSVAHGYDSYSWSTGENTNQIVIDQEGYYDVIVGNNPGCMSYDTVLVILPQADSTDNTNDTSTSLNPSNGQGKPFYVSGNRLWPSPGEEGKRYLYRIISMQGQVQEQGSLGREVMDLHHLKAGMYVIQLYRPEESYSIKAIIH